MKKVIVGVMMVLLSVSVYAGTRCERDPAGGICCWDTEKDGPFRPIGC